MAQVVVDGLEPVEVQVQGRDRSRLAFGEPGLEMIDQSPPIVEAREVVVVGQIPKALFGLHPGLHLREQRGDRLQSVELGGLPLAIADLHEPPQDTGGDVTGGQGGGGHRGLGDVAPFLDPLLVVLVLGAEDHGRLDELRQGEHRIGVLVVHDPQRVRIRYVGPNGPLGDQDRRPNRVVVVTQKTEVDVEVFDQDAEHFLRHQRRGRRVGRHEPDGDRRHQPFQAQGGVLSADTGLG